MLADITSLKIARIGSLSVDGGTFIYPLTFTLRDLVHKLLGRKAAQALILTAGAINVVMAALFAFVIWLPPDPAWNLQDQFSAILGPVWRIVLASIGAEVISELLDTEAYHLWVTRVAPSRLAGRFPLVQQQWLRVLISNAISVPIDSLIFSWGAFGGALPAATVWSIALSNVLIKGVVTLVTLPGIYLVPERQPQ
jgi:uncharacterized integral membrane protein (TIGR00697 family)